MNEPRTREEEIALLSARIEESGLSVSAFARDVLLRIEPQTQGRPHPGSTAAGRAEWVLHIDAALSAVERAFRGVSRRPAAA